MKTRGKLLIVDDEKTHCESLTQHFHEEGYEVYVAETSAEALARVAERHWDAALVDIEVREQSGLELQRKMRELDPGLVVITMGERMSAEAELPSRPGEAYEHVVKPLDRASLSHVISKALAHSQVKRENLRLRDAVAAVVWPDQMVGQSDAMRKVFDAVATVAPTDATVLITGESGTGKELVVRAIHAASPRRFHPLVVIHCGALTETLLESELFGYEKGAFTGAQVRKKGKFEIAEGGTVFLDEIGDISLKTQSDLLRVLQEREISRVGGNQVIPVDFRCVAATNKNLEQFIRENKFRPDLFYRLNVFQIEVPPLRERPDDIPALVEYYVRKFSLAMNKRITRIAPSAMEQLQRQVWPGNVRELENAVERAMVVGHEPELLEHDFALTHTCPAGGCAKTLEEMERTYILRVLEQCKGNQTHAARILGIDRVTLYHKLRKYGWTRTSSSVMQMTE